MCDNGNAIFGHQIEETFPTDERLAKGPVAIFECFQRIPCNPCFTACKKGAIKEFDDINDLPILNDELCSGCGLCIAKCPGLAIIVVDATYCEDEALIKIPYEFIPLPQKDQVANGLDREGKYVCDVIIKDVWDSNSLDKTPIISFSVPKKHMSKVRTISTKP